MKSERDRILDRVRGLVLKRHFNAAAIKHSEWVELFEEARPRLRDLPNTEFEREVNRLLRKLHTSHTVLYHETPTLFPSQHTIGATFRQIALDGQSRWMFLDVFPEGPTDRAGVAPGDVLLAIDGDERLLADPPQFGLGRSHTLTLARLDRSDIRTATVSVPTVKATKGRPPTVEPKSAVVSFAEPDLGILRVFYFPGSLGLRFNAMMDEAVQTLIGAGARRLILDLRGNVGGSLGFARLASHLCPGAIEIGFSVTPARARFGYRAEDLPRVVMPATRMGAALTLAQFAVRDKSLFLLTQSLGPKPFHGRMVVLTNEWTNSAGEIVAAFAKEQRLATIVGDRTRGNVLGASNFAVGGGYWLRLPVFGWFTANGHSLEGVGVEPDHPVDFDPATYSAESDPYIRAARRVLGGTDQCQRSRESHVSQ